MAITINNKNINLGLNVSAPASPGAGKMRLYALDTNRIFIKNSSGIEQDISGSATTLNSVSDVAISNPTGGDGLKYLSGQWINSPIPSYPVVLNDLADTTVISPSNNQVIYYNDVDSQYHNGYIKSGYFEKTGGTGGAGKAVANYDAPIYDKTTYIISESGRTTAGDPELADTYYYKPYGNDYGVYRLDGWFKIDYTGEFAPNGNIVIEFIELNGLSVLRTIELINEPFSTSPMYRFVSHTFKATDASSRNYTFSIYKNTTEDSATFWHYSSMRKFSSNRA